PPGGEGRSGGRGLDRTRGRGWCGSAFRHSDTRPAGGKPRKSGRLSGCAAAPGLVAGRGRGPVGGRGLVQEAGEGGVAALGGEGGGVVEGLDGVLPGRVVVGEQSGGWEVHGQAGEAGVAVGGEEALLVVFVAQGQGAVSGVAEVGFDAGEDAGGDALAAVVGVDGDGVDVADPVDEGAPYAGGDLRVEHPLGRADVDGADGGAVGGFGEQEVVQAVGERSALGAQGLRDGVLEGGEFVGGQVAVDEQGEVEVRVEFVGL